MGFEKKKNSFIKIIFLIKIIFWYNFIIFYGWDVFMYCYFLFIQCLCIPIKKQKKNRYP